MVIKYLIEHIWTLLFGCYVLNYITLILLFSYRYIYMHVLFIFFCDICMCDAYLGYLACDIYIYIYIYIYRERERERRGAMVLHEAQNFSCFASVSQI
jgi:hypothetical protein